MNQTLKVLRIDHWHKNLFVLLGSVAAVEICHQNYSFEQVWFMLLGFFLACLVSSVNYVINEFLDASYDAQHPRKKNRPVVSGSINPQHLFFAASWFLILAVAIAAWLHNWAVSLGLMVLFGSGILYNVEPARFKEVPVLDVLIESLNNPIRFVIGWYATASPIGFPSIILLCLVWMYGSFLMSAKRLAEKRFLGDRADVYRKTYRFYTEHSLKLLTSLYATITFLLYTAASLLKSPNMVYAAPAVAVHILWVFKLTLEKDSVMMDPEHAYRKRLFLLFSFLTLGIIVVLAESSIR
jgi:4-hydroxybenzoate polyprenyltransferase